MKRIFKEFFILRCVVDFDFDEGEVFDENIGSALGSFEISK